MKKKKIIILGSTGSIGKKTINILKQNKKEFNIELLSTNKNISEVIKQAKIFNVKNIIINDYHKFKEAKNKFRNLKINFYNSFKDLKKILKKNFFFYSMVSIVGLNGLYPTLKLIKHSKNIAIVNKESLICAWDIIQKMLKKYKTNFIPIDSEHFSIFELIKNDKLNNIEKVFITASGGPFLNYSKKKLLNVSIKETLNHPNWKMGKKISIDSATMMNKVFEVIEAKNIFQIDYKKIFILIHPKSYIHAIIKFYNGQIKLLAHEADMKIPIHNSLFPNNKKKIVTHDINLKLLNNLNLNYINKKKFPLTNILRNLPKKNSLFETALVTINDYYVEKFLNKTINFSLLVKLIYNNATNNEFAKYKLIYPKNIKDINKTIKEVSLKLDSKGI
jgi:1-deoxy-D-xylulose-5-phosphate reductoisomerase